MTAAEGSPGAVVEIVVPQRVETLAALARGADQVRCLRLVLAHDQDLPPAGGLARAAGELGQDVLALAEVVDVLGGVDPEPVDVELVDPVAAVRDHELAHRGRALLVEVEGLAPVGDVALG